MRKIQNHFFKTLPSLSTPPPPPPSDIKGDHLEIAVTFTNRYKWKMSTCVKHVKQIFYIQKERTCLTHKKSICV